MKNLNLKNIAAACEGTLYGEELVKEQGKEAAGVVIDSRLAEPGYVFIATKGERVDGHSFIPQVFEKGALAVICEVLPEPLPGPCILVKDSFQALREVAEYYRKQLTIPIVGVTGSVGKTSTKEFIAGVLSEKYNVLKTEGNFNNEVGLPLTVLRLRESHEAAVLEMGISHFGEMHRLSKIARPDICVMTNIGQCHLEFLGDRDGVLKAKSEMFDFRNPEGMICVNGDDDKLATLKSVWGERLLTFGKAESNDFHAGKVRSKGLFGSTMDLIGALPSAELQIPDVHIREISLPLPGEHMVYNALAAAAVASCLGLTGEQIRKGIASVQAVGGRSNLIRCAESTLIDDCYNANPVSMKAALELLQYAEGRRVAVLGDMFELGENEDKLHRQVGAYAAEGRADVLVCVGALSKYMYEGAEEVRQKKDFSMELYYMETREELLEKLDQIKKPGDTILLKASHGMGFAEVVTRLQEQSL